MWCRIRLEPILIGLIPGNHHGRQHGEKHEGEEHDHPREVGNLIAPAGLLRLDVAAQEQQHHQEDEA